MSVASHPASLEAAALARAAEVHAATAELATTLLALDRSGEVVGGGIRSIGHWADVNLGVPSPVARRLVRVAERLESLPLLAAAFAAGELSLEKVDALSAVASPASDGPFAEIGRAGSLSQVRRICEAYRRRCDDDDPDANRERRGRRRFSSSKADDGLVRIVAVLEADEAAIVLAAVDARVEDSWRRQRAGEPAVRAAAVDAAPDLGGRRADALVELATEGMEIGPDPVVRGRRVEVTVHVDLALLAGDAEDGRCHIEGVGSVPLSTVERLLCDCSLVTMFEVDGLPLDVGRRRHTVTPKQRRALRSRDRGCRFPGCHQERFVDAHHVVAWLHGGPTDMDNLVSLCSFHHHLFHRGGFTIEATGRGGFVFRRPDGREVAPPRLRAGPTGRRPVGSPQATDGGAPFDLGLTIDGLAEAS